MIILEGKKTIENPTEQDVERELALLDAGEIKSVSLHRDKEFIKAVRHEKQRYLQVEARALHQMYEQTYPATFGTAVELFNTFLGRPSFSINSSWKPMRVPVKQAILVILALAGVLLIGGLGMVVFLLQNTR